MHRIVATLLLGLLLGCPAATPSDDDDATPPVGDDDDDVTGPLAPVLGHTPGWGQVDLEPGEGALAPCEFDQLLEPECVELEHRGFALDVRGCPVGDYTFDAPQQWTDFLADCGHAGDDPLAGEVDWEAEFLRVHAGSGEGCGVSLGTLWLAGCPQGRVLGHWFHPCGYCDDLQERVLAVPLPVELAPVGLLHCVPANVRCSS